MLMTNGLDSTSDDPFQVVLIDIIWAANREIYCIKEPLTEELKYVAISYRWGELQEFIADTRVGYSASITSFDVNDLYKLCKAILKDPTMASIPYVWVDAICINQSNYGQRKATIYHMSDIYKHATWILAVPDLHAIHLNAMHEPVMDTIQKHQVYLYHLLHGHTNKLHEMDHEFLDEIGVPQDLDLRQLLTKYTESFTDSFMTPVALNPYYDHIHTIEHLYNNNKTSRVVIDKGLRSLPHIQTPHQCDEMDCPLEYFHNLSKIPSIQHRSGEWGRLILERRTAIQHAMHFLTALVVDWSSRVWVISEFHIAKNKNNLMFWFNQLDLRGLKVAAFFTFNMDDPRLARIQNTKIPDERYPKTLNPVYITFYQRLINQLNRQSFLEMMLKSKASKNEDRFRAIFPFFPEYKHFLQTEALDNMNSILDVKLKLYKVMTNEHKLMLLYLSSKGATASVLPTFATSAIDWSGTDDHKHVDLAGPPVDITLLYQETVGHYLSVKPTKYEITRDAICFDDAAQGILNRLLYPKRLRNDDRGTCVDVLRLYDTVPTPHVLVGSFNENTWILGNYDFHYGRFDTVEDLADDFLGFRVY